MISWTKYNTIVPDVSKELIAVIFLDCPTLEVKAL
jgi:hypothetical protein